MHHLGSKQGMEWGHILWLRLRNKPACLALSLSCFSCRSFAAVGVDPAVMGVGPAFAIPAAVKAAGLELNDIDLFEINEVEQIKDCLL